jgi:hypothetical protein
MSDIDLHDIFRVYVKGEVLPNINKNTPLPLHLIKADFSTLRKMSMERLNAVLGEMFDIAPQKKQKPDPMSALFQNIDTNDDVNESSYRGFITSEYGVKKRSNFIGRVNMCLATLSPNIIKVKTNDVDAVVMIDNKPIVVIRLINRPTSINQAAARKIEATFNRVTDSPESKYFGCRAFVVERIPKATGNPTPFYGSKSVQRIRLQQFLEMYSEDKESYLKGLLLNARYMAVFKKLPRDHDMRWLFGLLEESIGRSKNYI